MVFIDLDGDKFEVDTLVVPPYIEDLKIGTMQEYYLAKIKGANRVVALLIAIKNKQGSVYRKFENEKLLAPLIRGLSIRHSMMRYYAIFAGIGGWILGAIVAGTLGRFGFLGSLFTIIIPVLWAVWLIYPTVFWKKYGNISSLDTLLTNNMISDNKITNSGKY